MTHAPTPPPTVTAITASSKLAPGVGEAVPSRIVGAGHSRRRSSHLKEVPQSRSVRERLRLLCSQAASRVDRTHPLTKTEMEAISRQVLGELLLEMSNVRKQRVATDSNDSHAMRLVIVAATNRICDIDEALLRRFDRMVKVELPNHSARREILRNCLVEISHVLTGDELVELANKTEGWSGGDLKLLAR